jgi:hypothetical protein
MHDPAAKHGLAEVGARLDEIVAWARRERQPVGYFATLYRHVTQSMVEGIAAGRFEDGPRMERMNVLFAQRYFAAFDAFRRSRPMTRSWRLAFDMSRRRSPIVLQHLLIGMNAHINLDLGIAAADVAPGASLPSLERDFFAINEVLASLLHRTKDELSHLWTPLRVIDLLSGPATDAIFNFRMSLARDGAWRFAQGLVTLSDGERAACIEARDASVAALGRRICRPSLPTSALLWVVRAGESGDVTYKLDALAR